MKLKHIIHEMAAQTAVKQIKPTDKVIMTADAEIKFRNISQQGHVDDKPRGLWYAVGKSWIEWVRDNMPQWEQDNIFKIETTSKIAIIKNREDALKFTAKYGMINPIYSRELLSMLDDKEKMEKTVIDWGAVAKDYAGIQTYFYNSWSIGWTKYWDVPSGCVWHSSGVKKIIKYEL